MYRRTFLRLSAAAVSAALGAAATQTTVVEAAPPAPARPAAPNVVRGGNAPTIDKSLPAHPVLQAGAKTQPDKTVRVIVQRYDDRTTGARIAANVGARSREDFRSAKSSTVELSQRDIVALARQPGVRFVSPDARVLGTGNSYKDVSVRTLYPQEVGATSLWGGDGDNPEARGKDIGVAVLDTGFSNHADFDKRLVQVKSNPLATNADDQYGHGTHVAGIIAGSNLSGGYVGIAPEAKILGVKVTQDNGTCYMSDLLRGLEWVFDNRDKYKIRVLNLSCTTSIPESYKTNILSAALEQLWFAGVTVVVSAGNFGMDSRFAATQMHFAPANDPYLIAVGAVDSMGTTQAGDDTLLAYSSRGTTQDGIAKPDVVAPGRQIYSTLASTTCAIARQFPDRITDGKYIRLSGTSMAAPIVAGTVALLLQKYPKLTPNQVKAIITRSGVAFAGPTGAAKMISASAALALAKKGGYGAANDGLVMSNWLTSGDGSVLGDNSSWDNSSWDNSSWDNSSWDNVNWNYGSWD